MARMTEAIERLERYAADMKTDLNTAAVFVKAWEKDQKAEHDANATTPESKEKLTAYMSQSNGSIQDLSPKDICLNAGVTPNAGNKRFVHKNRALLTHKP